jgi:hypothetical protein
VPFSGRKTDLTHLFCVIFTFEGVIKGLKNWLKMTQKQLGLSKNRGENAFFGSA